MDVRADSPKTATPAEGVAAHEAEAVLERLARIEHLNRADAGPEELLAELRMLVEEVEAWSGREGGEAGEEAAARLRQALARDLVEA